MKRFGAALLLVAVLAPAGSAPADGPPVTFLDAGPGGVVERAGDDRFVALPAATETVLVRSRRKNGKVTRATVLDGRWGVPVVTEDGTSSGAVCRRHHARPLRARPLLPAQALELRGDRPRELLRAPHVRPAGRVGL